jgi:hypothetical protein
MRAARRRCGSDLSEDANTDFNAELAEFAEVLLEMLCVLRALGV